MYGYVYKTTNLTNNKIYIGQHKVNNDEFDTSYFGSGTYLKEAINKYGIENFKCELLEWCNSEEELDKRELELIDEYKSLFIYGNYNLSNKKYIPRDSIKNRYSWAEYNKTKDYSINSEKNKGKKFMNNGEIQCWVNKEDIQEYLDNGYAFGACKKRNRDYSSGPWNKGKHGVQKNCKSTKGYIRITNGNINTTVKMEELQSYLDKGFYKGITKHIR